MGNCCLRKQLQEPNQPVIVVRVSSGFNKTRVSQTNISHTITSLNGTNVRITSIKTSPINPIKEKHSKLHERDRKPRRPTRTARTGNTSFVSLNTHIPKERDQDKRRGKELSSIEKVNKKKGIEEALGSQFACGNISFKVHCFHYCVLKDATQNFRKKNFIGEGGFGDVHKGYVTYCTFNACKPNEGRVVAVKRLIHHRPQGSETWKTEVEILGKLNHPNVVQLIGCCNEGDQRILVYEYMTKGSLDTLLFKARPSTENRKELNWRRRIQIALGAAKGLAYLHTRGKPIIHRDIKASNVLLDSDFNAKISDFGLARYGPEDENNHVSTRVIGTKGYLAPEYFRTGHLTFKADVYSFGVVLLEILTGSSVDKKCSTGLVGDLVQRAMPLLCSKPELPRVIDRKLRTNFPVEEAHKFAQLTYQCLSEDQNRRPTMTEVVAGLEQLQHDNAGHSTHHSSARVTRFSACPPPSSKKSSGNYGCG
ncbi:Mitogen-activated protein kinase kinase kinase [Parasponia andersonii]|uniref:Mitogen-activated protein kinase kinase kinase n=1 Tax=Parasponia andersonii TaxID=3476 RepID=A0A2P5AUP0_PARAD|nr:Mitogen-activated protein kinase kinase kinase [Parasponia andersonii]